MASGAIAAIVFDFDGVLADTEPLHLAAFQDVFSRRGWALTSDDYFSRYLGHGDEALIDAFAGDRRLEVSASDAAVLLSEKSAAFRDRLGTGSVLYPGAAACVARLAGNFRLAIASGALRAEVTDVLAAHGLLASFPVIVAIEDVVRGKPDPEPYRLAAARLGVDPRVSVAIEDSRWGLESARACGMRTIGITTTSSAADLASADRVVQSLDEITLDLLSQVGSPAAV
jgi:HAD superfamily hydrolase (TIGR01509 family)